MACASVSFVTSPTAKESLKGQKQSSTLTRSVFTHNLYRCTKIRRSYSDNNLCFSSSRVRASVNQSQSQSQPQMKNSRSMGIFNFNIPGPPIPKSIQSFLFDPETSKQMNVDEKSVERYGSKKVDNMKMQRQMEIEMEKEKKRANWIERLMEIRSQWIQKQQQNDEMGLEGEGEKGCNGDEDGEGVCEADYSDDDDEDEVDTTFDRETFSKLLKRVSWSDTKLFSQLAFLSNMAYVIPEIKPEDLRRCYDLEFVTSSLEKKALAEAITAELNKDLVQVPDTNSSSNQPNPENREMADQKRFPRSSVAYEIAASAASYVQSRAKGLLSLKSEPQQEEDEANLGGKNDYSDEEEGSSSPRLYNSEMAAYMAASTMTAVVAAGEKEKLEAAKSLQSVHSSPCEWFVCDDTSIYTRCFIIQGSDSVASWQANLFFEPTKFEETHVLVHRGIYEAAKGIYEQLMPEILEHMEKYGERAKFQFTGHSLGGSLSLLINLMLLTRKVVKPSALRPVVTFGSPFVFCGGQKILDELGLDENHVHCVMMHRDIVPRAFSCKYPDYVAQLLKRLSGTFRSHTCLNKNKLLYTPMGKMFILQPDEKFSPAHPLLPPGSALYTLENSQHGTSKSALRAFLNSPHPIQTLRHPTAYGSDGTILRDHDSSNYLKAVNGVIRQHTKMAVRQRRKQPNILWPLLTSQSPHSWSQERTFEDKGLIRREVKRLVTTEVMTGA